MKLNKQLKNWVIIISLLSIGFLGLAVCKVFDVIFFEKENDLMGHPAGSAFVLIFACIFIFATIVLIPFQIFFVDRKERKKLPTEKLTFGDLLLLPLGLSNPDAEVPKWISIPIKLLLFLLLIAVVVPLIIFAILKWFS